jgi:hypothetical protein
MSAQYSCVWCGGGRLSAEHVIPDWIGREFTRRALASSPDVAKVVGHNRLNRGGDVRIWNPSPLTVTVRAVCRRCNNGWMAAMERETQPLLLRLFTGEAVVLHQAAQIQLASWAFKTAVVMDQIAETPSIPGPDAHTFYQDRRPVAGVYVVLGSRAPEPLPAGVEWKDHSDSAFLRLKSRSLDDPSGTLEAYKKVIALGPLLFQVIGFTNISDVGGVQHLAADSTRIWPYETDREWPGGFGKLTVAETIPQHIELAITNDE